jgi:hypothetical protein
MANASIRVIRALRNTIDKLKSGAAYQWGHMGACNCGNLAQEVTRFSKAEIHAYAMQRHGDWSEQLNDYCPESGLPVDLLIGKLVEEGFTLKDLIHLERLSDPWVLEGISPARRNSLRKNSKQDLILYLESWLRKLETIWLQNLEKPKQEKNPEINFDPVLA